MLRSQNMVAVCPNDGFWPGLADRAPILVSGSSVSCVQRQTVHSFLSDYLSVLRGICSWKPIALAEANSKSCLFAREGGSFWIKGSLLAVLQSCTPPDLVFLLTVLYLKGSFDKVGLLKDLEYKVWHTVSESKYFFIIKLSNTEDKPQLRIVHPAGIVETQAY